MSNTALGSVMEGLQSLWAFRNLIQDRENLLNFLLSNTERMFIMDKSSDWKIVQFSYVNRKYLNSSEFSSSYSYGSLQWPEVNFVILASMSYNSGSGGDLLNMTSQDLSRLEPIDLGEVTAYLGGNYVSTYLMQKLRGPELAPSETPPADSTSV